jgi:putative endonuclease
MRKRSWSVYMVQCADGSLYTGVSPDVVSRVAAHNAGRGARYTRSRRPVRLVFLRQVGPKPRAMSIEWHLKRLTRAQKLKVVRFKRLPRGLVPPL